MRRKARLSTMAILKLALCILLFTYVFIRVLALDITNDELPKRVTHTEILSCSNVGVQSQATIYLLNTLCYDLLPFDRMFSMRLPSLLAFIIYLWAAWRMTSPLKPPWTELLGFAGITGSAFLLDYFSIGRSYGITMAMSLLATSFLIDAITAPTIRRARSKSCLAAWLGLIAVVSNLAFLYFYIGLCGVLSIHLVIRRLKSARLHGQWMKSIAGTLPMVWRDMQHLVTACVVLAVYYVPRILMMQAQGSLTHGADNGYVTDTVGSLLTCIFYGLPAPEALVSFLTWAIVASAVTMFLHLLIRRCSDTAALASLALGAILLLHALFSILFHIFFGALFATDRTALILWPLFIGQLAFYMAGVRRTPLKIAAGAMLVILTCVGAAGMNLTHTLQWRINSMSSRLLRELEQLRKETHDSQIILGVSDIHKHRLWFHKERQQAEWMQYYTMDMYGFANKYMIHPQTDYFYVYEPDGQLPHYLQGLPLEPVPHLDFSPAQSTLYQVKTGTDLSRFLTKP